MNVSRDVPMLSHVLSAEGYRTHYVGKTHFQAFGGNASLSAESIGGDPARYPAWTGPYYGFQTVELSLGHTTWGLNGGHYGAFLGNHATAEQLARSETPSR